MGGSTVTLTQAVSPGAQYQISVPMVAPATAGEATGTWKMADTNGYILRRSALGDSHCNRQPLQSQYAKRYTDRHALTFKTLKYGGET